MTWDTRLIWFPVTEFLVIAILIQNTMEKFKEEEMSLDDLVIYENNLLLEAQECEYFDQYLLRID